MSQMPAATLVAGFASYTSAPDLGEAYEAAPAVTPAILSFIAASSVACGGAVSAISSGGTTATIIWGC